jgi:hypothetical protein
MLKISTEYLVNVGIHDLGFMITYAKPSSYVRVQFIFPTGSMLLPSKKLDLKKSVSKSASYKGNRNRFGTPLPWISGNSAMQAKTPK